MPAPGPRRTSRAPHAASPVLKVGDLLAGKYRVERILGEGGMGVVVAAYHELLDQRVAVKLLYQDVADREASERLLFEARAAAKIQSEHVARVVDVDTGADGLPFIVMELLEGQDLAALLDAQGPLPPWVVVDYVLQALDGLAHAHARGIVHRDLKPSNLFLAMLPDGSPIVKILDFGISKATGPGDGKRTAQLTGGIGVLGSPPYMSPEQIRAPKSIDARSDVWALGIVMYELLTGVMPFGGDEMQETFAQILERTPVPVGSMARGLPPGLEHVVMRCLSKDRARRFADVGELANALVPYGGSVWRHLAPRIVATLARGAGDESSGPRLPTVQMPIPSSPRSRELDASLTGTANTLVAPRFGGGGPMLWVAIIAPVVLVIGLASAFVVLRKRPPAGEPPPLVVLAAPEREAVPAASTFAEPLPFEITEGPPGEPLPGAASHPTTRRPAPSARPAAPPASAKRPSKSALPSGLPQTRE